MAYEMPKTMSIPEAGKKYYDLSINASYAAAKRGEIPYVQVGKLKRVPVAAMERKLEQVESPAVPPPDIAPVPHDLVGRRRKRAQRNAAVDSPAKGASEMPPAPAEHHATAESVAVE